jgi:hypothetical protein
MACFSTYFRDQDDRSLYKINNAHLVNKQYAKVMDRWQRPLEKKKVIRAKREENPATRPDP